MSRHFSHWLNAYIEYTVDSESPVNFHFWTGIATIAGALRRRVWIDMRKFIWTPNFYIVLVAPAGIAAKSTSISIGMDLLSQLPKEAGIHFGPESMTWQKLADSLGKATEYFRFIDNNGVEAVRNMSALTCAVSELGTFFTMEDDKQLSFLIRMWDGGDATFTHATQVRGNVEVKNPWLNIIAATTPTWLAQNFPAVMIGGGLASRILFVHEEKKRFLRPYPDEYGDSAEYNERRRKLIEDLFTISTLAGPYTITEEARIWGRQWYEHLHNGARPVHLRSDKFSGYLARKQTHTHKLAMIMAAAKRNNLIITLEDLREANLIIDSLEPEMIKAFESLGQNDEARAIVEITNFLRQNGGTMAFSTVVKNVGVQLRGKVFETAIQTGCNGGLWEVWGNHTGSKQIKLRSVP
jgi:hypothetical protein